MRWLNLTTSFLFGITSIYAYYRNVIALSTASIYCFISSILYHGSCLLHLDEDLCNSFKIIDIIVCNFCVTYFSIIGCSYGINIWMASSILCIIYMFTLYYWFNLSNHPDYGYYVHSSIHLVGNIGVCLMLEVFLLYGIYTYH